MALKIEARPDGRDRSVWWVFSTDGQWPVAGPYPTEEVARDGRERYVQGVFEQLAGPIWHIWSNEHGAWWAPNGNGYVANVDEAGRYTTEQAKYIVRNSAKARRLVPEEVMVPVRDLLVVLGALAGRA